MQPTDRTCGYGWEKFRRDLVSGIIVGLIAIPLGMAFAIASGVEPEYGLYTTVIAGMLISLLGGSRYQIGGPTGAFIPVLLAIVLEHGYERLLTAGLLAGILLVIMGLLKAGSIIAYIPKAVTVGFTAGIAVIIFTGQIGNFLGLQGMRQHEFFLQNIGEVLRRLPAASLESVCVASVCLAVMLILPRVTTKIPPALAGIAAATAVSLLLFDGRTATIESVYGAIPSSLPALALPDLSWGTIVTMLPSALLIAALGSIESLLSAVVADGMTGTRHNSNRELVGQGIANIVTPLFGGIPATGAIARTAANIRTGAASRMSGVIHGVVVLLVLVLLAPQASKIPLAAMAPVLMVVAWNMSERRAFKELLRKRSPESVVLVATFALTVFINLIAGVGCGLALVLLYRLREAVRRRGAVRTPAGAVADSVPLSRRRGRG